MQWAMFDLFGARSTAMMVKVTLAGEFLTGDKCHNEALQLSLKMIGLAIFANEKRRRNVVIKFMSKWSNFPNPIALSFLSA